MYSWATPEKLLDEMTLDQIIFYYRYGWEAREAKARVFWGILGEIMAGTEGEKARQQISKRLPDGIAGLSEFKKAHPGEKTETGAWKASS